MKSIEERAREEYPYITPSDGYECHAYNEAAKDGFIARRKNLQMNGMGTPKKM